MKNWHTQNVDSIVENLKSSLKTGLSVEEVKTRLQKHGPNLLEEKKGRSPFKMLLDQLTETMVLILIVAAIISGFLGKETETIAIATIVILFALLGFFQEYRAEKAMEALKQMAVPLVQVLRNSVIKEIFSKDLVPGDIVLLEAGNIIPADCRIVESFNLKVQEASLTGEAVPVEKWRESIPKTNTPINDRFNMLYMGTNITTGRAKALVTETGMDTELGKIAGMLQTVDVQKTPLQQKLHQLGKTLALAGGVAALIILLMGLYRGESLADMFLVAISVAVAVVPEGLPAVVTITLALGSQKMLRRNVLIRKLPAVETLGSVTVICSDKTGTLTENKITVNTVSIDDKLLSLPLKDPASVKDVELLLYIGTLCNDTKVMQDDTKKYVGDPTETALVSAADSVGIFKKEAERFFHRIHELPFDSKRMRMSTIHTVPKDTSLSDLKAFYPFNAVLLTKGAVDGLLPLCSKQWTSNGVVELDEASKQKIYDANQKIAEHGGRVLGFAYKGVDDRGIGRSTTDDIEHDLIFVGLTGMIDPPRKEVRTAIAKCQTAGIRPVMITGDHPTTASAIAQSLNLSKNSNAMTGENLIACNDIDLRQSVHDFSVFARVAPSDKLRIVEALQSQQEIVAMTGDGVNDSPALKKADIGVAMGVTGTGVAKEASDMVLLDDNFNSIVMAVEEGRSIFDNLLRFVKFSLGGNFAKVLVMLLAPFFGMLIALRPLQLLWLNLLTDGLLGLGVGMEPAEQDVMMRPPRKKNAPVLDTEQIIHISWVGCLIALITLGIGIFYFDPSRPDDPYWQTMLFATIGFTQIGHALGLRAYGHKFFSFASNPSLSILTVIAIVLQLVAIYSVSLQEYFMMTPLKLTDLALSCALGIMVLLAVRTESIFRHKNKVR